MSESEKTYPRPSLTADIVVVACDPSASALRLLLIQRAHAPFAGAWALPGGFCEPGETVAAAAARELEEETHLRGLHLGELGVYSAPGRDPRGWVVSVAHLALLSADRLGDAAAGDDAAEARWWRVEREPGGGFRLAHEAETIGDQELAFDHHAIITAALARLRERAGDLALALLPRRFRPADVPPAVAALTGEAPDAAALEAWLVCSGRVLPSETGWYVAAPPDPSRLPWTAFAARKPSPTERR